MTDTSQTPAAESSLRLFAIVSYVLLLLGCSNGLTAIVAVVLATIKRGEARGTIYQSHFSNIITVFWVGAVLVALLIAAAGAGAIVLLSANPPQDIAPTVGIAIVVYGVMVLFAVWYLYRTIKGLVRALDGKAY
ncbi:MAG TPA: hypothetical protein VGF56_17465 [Rhizomicrobium sp.]|jgi:uncharacterized membrane protein